MVSSNNITVCAIAALTKDDRVIGKDGDIPWEIPEDLKHFAQTTKRRPVIMGRRTWESFDDKYRPLPERPNIVITRNNNYRAPGAAAVVHSPQSGLDQALAIAQENDINEVYVIGGQSIYKTLLPDTQKLVLTLIDADIDGDRYFPSFRDEFTHVRTKKTQHGNNPPFSIKIFDRN